MKLFNLILTSILWINIAFANGEIYQFDNPQQEADYRYLIQSLRCPQCQNNNIADSNATIATDMRHKTLELLKQGKKREDVVDYMVERYGHFVTYDPPITPATILLWLMPLLLICVGGIWLFKRRSNTLQAVEKNEKSVTKLDHERLKQILNSEDKQ